MMSDELKQVDVRLKLVEGMVYTVINPLQIQKKPFP